MIPGFDNNFSMNFDHLMFADDLILITKASWSAAHYINLCLSIYSRLTSQHPNHSKSQIFIPSWFNRRVAISICSILEITPASYPLTYLGILISPKQLCVQSFNPMIDMIRGLCARWKTFHFFGAAKSVLINTSIISIPTYYLSAYPIPDSVLLKITKIVRNFFFGIKVAMKRASMISFGVALLIKKTKGGLGFRNLAHAKHSLMAKKHV